MVYIRSKLLRKTKHDTETFLLPDMGWGALLLQALIQDPDLLSNFREFWNHKAHLRALRGELFAGPGILNEAQAFALCPSQLLERFSSPNRMGRGGSLCTSKGRRQVQVVVSASEHLGPKTHETYPAKTPPAHATFQISDTELSLH